MFIPFSQSYGLPLSYYEEAIVGWSGLKSPLVKIQLQLIDFIAA